VHVLEALEHLVHDILLVNVFQDVGADNCVQVSIHEVEHQVDVPIILCADHILQPDDVFVAGQLLQENDFSERALGVRRILEGIEVLLQGNDLFRALVDGLPDNSVCSFTYIIDKLNAHSDRAFSSDKTDLTAHNSLMQLQTSRHALSFGSFKAPPLAKDQTNA